MKFDLENIFKIAKIELKKEEIPFFEKSLLNVGLWIDKIFDFKDIFNSKECSYNILQDLGFYLRVDKDDFFTVDKKDFLDNALKSDGDNFLIQKVRD